MYKEYRTNNARTKLKMRPWIYKIASFALFAPLEPSLSAFIFAKLVT
jgi:hypothetical protein